ncbi:MBL fold metallo-hydrolase [Flavobacterium urocaniciphilum]|uniref:L-ascorbate metabolism protein UlaG, beta-lactamase superfamily n=1 Tax=Flavobacterium urocaniciphilum TaxID=1299341 RepID=A0A1H9DVR4_9FLAO|nr:MBL fold metallo-hydrolase [Flavobacterium urocaniciphilum]SEQ17417.1 L-ascorbate metabolism protein UlaG, beta-lactamase superfamily [Flavobacterium urocaniciphilum]
MVVLFSILFVLVLAGFLFMQQEQFGKKPSGARLETIKKSPNYYNNAFQNFSHTPSLTEGVSFYSVLKEFLFVKNELKKPNHEIPSVKTDLFQLDPNENVVVWFGHSSYFIQIDGKKVLVDPVFSGSVSPVSFTNKAFEGANNYSVNDIPEIDYLFITHDHWDHLDYKTVKQLQAKVKKVICGLGVGAHLEHWGYDASKIIEKDWYEKIILDTSFEVNTVPARHFSGRGFKRNTSLWLSFVFKTPSANLFIGGDSGYDKHFAEIGNLYGPFDLVFLENGQYDKSWKYIHMQPNEVLQAANDLKAKALFPVHSSKFVLANHNWNEPLSVITSLVNDSNLHMFTPLIGEKTHLQSRQTFSKWWEIS